MMASDLIMYRFEHDERVFKNQVPITRGERHASRDKESKEKALLEQRPAVLGQKYINYGRNIAAASEGTVAYISEQERFFTDFAAEEKLRREAHLETKQEQINRKRYEMAVAEEERWNRIDKEYLTEEQKQSARQARGVPSNESSVPYDPLTLQYRPNDAGENLKYTDEQIRYRAALRAKMLYDRDSREPHNPITGERKPDFRMPPRTERR